MTPQEAQALLMGRSPMAVHPALAQLAQLHAIHPALAEQALRANPQLQALLLQQMGPQPAGPQYRQPLPGGYRGTAQSGEFPVAGAQSAGNEGR